LGSANSKVLNETGMTVTAETLEAAQCAKDLVEKVAEALQESGRVGEPRPRGAPDARRSPSRGVGSVNLLFTIATSVAGRLFGAQGSVMRRLENGK
jgi:hypothetical protein